MTHNNTNGTNTLDKVPSRYAQDHFDTQSEPWSCMSSIVFSIPSVVLKRNDFTRKLLKKKKENDIQTRNSGLIGEPLAKGLRISAQLKATED
jgi:hypothetical protein